MTDYKGRVFELLYYILKKYWRDKMNEISEKARTIEEKSKEYSENIKIDYRYFDEWRDVRTLLSDRYFEEMLIEIGMSKEMFAFSLQPSSSSAVFHDDWYDKFEEIINAFDYTHINYSVGVYLPTLPFNKYLAKEIRGVVEKIEHITVCEKVIDTFIEAHLLEMFNIIGKIVAISLEEYKQNHSFKNTNKEERFQEFLRDNFFSKECFINLFRRYPVAARVATVRTIYLINNFADILKNIDKDYLEIKHFLNMPSLNLTEIILSTGDSHEQGKAVSILKFVDKKLVYKPKNLKISEAFEKFIDWYTSNSNLLPIKIPKGIYKDNYTYNEFITPKFCENEQEVANFYIRFGYLIALCYLVNLNDLHLENIIAHGEYPVIVDIETAFQVSPDMENQTLYIDLFKMLEVESISNSFLLPRQVSVGIKDQVDLSALKGKETKLSSKMLSPVKINTDEFHFENVPSYFEGGNNIPMVSEKDEVDVKRYYSRIIEGFEEFMHFIMKYKKECLEVLKVFKGEKVRILLKGTEKYASMIRYANHPAYNYEMKYRERLMMNIWAYPYLDKRVIKSEVKDLLFNDIPIFYSYTDSKDIVDSRGDIYKDYHCISGYDLAVNKINNLTERSFCQQRIILLLALGIGDSVLNQKITKREISYSIQDFDYLKQAKKIANVIIEESIRKNDKCSLINIDCNEKKHWKMVPCDESLYGGLSGISLFYLELYKRTEEDIYLEYYQLFIRTAIEQTKNTGFQSAFSGWLSPMYPLMLEYKYFNTISDKKYLDFTIEKLESLKLDDIHKITKSDYISGISSIICLLSMGQSIFGKEYISDDIIKKFAKSLLKRIDSGEEKAANKVGVAHGISGLMLGLAFGKVCDATVIKKYLLKETQRKISSKNVYKWCWGLSGMIQARLVLLNIMPSSVDMEQLGQLIEEFHKSLKSMRNVDCLCHGNASVVVTLKMIYEYTKEVEWKMLAELWLTNIYMNAQTENYKVSHIGDIQAKGLFDGISGIGWLYLYTFYKSNNVLLLETING